MPKSERRGHGRGFSSPGYAYVLRQYHRTRQCGGRKLNNVTRRGQGGCRRAWIGSPPNYSSIDASDERINVPTDQHSGRHYLCTDFVDCPERQQDRQYGRMNAVSSNYSNPECGYRDAFCSSENPLFERVSSRAMKRDEYVTSNEHDYRLGCHEFSFSDRKYHAFDQQNRLNCEQDGKNQNNALSVVRIKTQNSELLQKSTNASDNNFLYWISSILSCLVKNGNRMELEQLQREIEHEHGKQYSHIEMEIENFPNIFDISENISDTETDDNEEEGILRDKYVSGKTDVRLCENHCSNAGSCSSEDCNGLHICKFYILSTCSFEPCAFGHDIRDPHNVRVLKLHLLHALSPEDLGYLMRNIRNRNETTMPAICRFYNRFTGCSRSECQFLHLCRWFVKGDCIYDKCQRSHNYSDQQPSMVLRRYGILEEKHVEAVKSFLRCAESTMENKSNTVITSGTEFSEDYSRLNRFVRYYQGHTGEGNGIRPSKSSIMNVSKLEESVSAENIDSMSDQTPTADTCNEIEDGECDSEHSSPNWIERCLPIPSCNGKREGKDLTQFCLDTNEIDTSGDRKVGTVSERYLKLKCMDQTDLSKHLEKPCFSESKLTTTTSKQDNFNNDYSGTECVQAKSPTVIENCCTEIPVDDDVLGGLEQRLSVTRSQNHANSSLPTPSCNEKPKGKDPSQFCVDTAKKDNAADRRVGTVSEGYLQHERMDQTDQSQLLEKPCYSDCLLTTLNNKQNSFNSGFSDTECAQAMSPTIIENSYTGIPADGESLGRTEQKLAVTITQKHAISSRPDDARNLELKRVISKDGMPTWRYRCIDNMKSLSLEPDLCDHLEKSYQQFQQTRKCSIEILGLKLDVDLLTVEEEPVILPIQATHETP